jgi:hypothetical protein
MDMAGDTFVSKGIEYVLRQGPNGNLRPYTVGPMGGDKIGDTIVSKGIDFIQGQGLKGIMRRYTISPIMSKGVSMLPTLGWVGLAIGVAAFVGAGIWYVCKDEQPAEEDENRI